MSINCANITSEEYKKLKAKFGEDKANYLWNKLNGTIPEDISKLVPIEFKKAQILMPYTIVKALKEAGIDHTKLTHQQLKDMIDPDVLEGLAYRIPNQAAASNDAFEIVGILPENAGDTIIAFKEITTKTGSDFDIDKAYVMLPNFIYDKETGRFSTIKDDSKKGLQNERLRLSNLMLSNPKKYPQLMKPLDTDWAKTLILGNKDKNIEPLIKINKTVQDLNFWTGVTQTFNKAEFDNTKTLVGPIAKNMTNHNAIKHDGITYTNTYLGLGMFKTIEEEITVVENPIMEKPSEIQTSKYELFPGVFANEGQKIAIDKLTNFINSPKSEFLLMGKGGTGKTTIIKKILENLPKNDVLGLAPSHKAKKVLRKSINTDTKKYNTSTLESALAIKLNENTGFFEPDEYARKKGNIPITKYKYIVLDEGSMVSDKLLAEIKKFMRADAKIIYMGDKAQLPPVGQETDSKVFDTVDYYELTEKMRQAKTSPIINIGTKVAANVETSDENRKLNIIDNTDRQDIYDETSGSSIIWEKNLDKALDNFVSDFKNNPTDVNNVKIVTFNNQNHNNLQSVKNLNEQVREKLYGERSKEQFLPGELLTAYSRFSIDEGREVDKILLENSEDFIIDSIRSSTVNDFVSVYSKVKGNRTFNYSYNVKILTLKNDEGEIIEHEIPVIAAESKEKYREDLAKLWKSDTQLALALSKQFADLEYGYAITSHKAQGSTYNNVYVMEDNILGPSNGGSIKSKNQSLYVAVSRPKNKLVMVSEKNPESQELKILPKQEESKQDNKTTTNNPKEFTNYSGAAEGSDTEWETIGKEYGIGKQVNFVANTYDKLSDIQKEEVENAYKKVVKELNRKELSLTDSDPKKAYGAKLVRRNYLQAKAADSIFAIVEGFDNNNLPKGGTAYATMMATYMNKPVHIFNQEDKRWYEAKYTEDGNFYGFEQSASIPVLTPKYAGIGTRKINESGKQAIKDVYKKTFNNTESQKTAVGQSTQQSNKRTITTSRKESLVSTDIDEDGNSVEETLTGYMNAIVDGVKDPYIVKGNINLFTGGIAFMLARAGVSRNWISAFMVQPIMVDLVKQMNISESRISEISRDEKGETNKALDVILKKYGSQLTGADFKSDLTKDNLKNKEGDIKTTFEDLKRQLDNPNPAMQLKVLKQFFEFQDVSWKLSDLMTIMSADTDGATKNDITATMRDNLFHAVINNNTFTGLEKVLGYSKEENGEIKIDDTKYIGTFHKNSVQFFKKISKEQFITSSDSFKHAAYTIANYAGYSELKSKKHAEIITLIEQELFASFIEESKILSFDTIEELQLNVIGPNELIQRTNQQMAIEVNNQNKALLENEGRILTDVERMSVMSPYLKKLQYLKSQKNLAQRVSDAQITYPDNLFLKSLLVDVNPYMNGKPSTIGLNSKNLNKDAKNTLYLYWEDLLNKDEKLAEDLIKYSFYASGLSNNFGAFFEHIPTNWLVKKGLNDFMNEKLQSLNESHTNLLHLQRQVMRHLHKDDRIVPTISDKIVTEFISPLGDIVPRQFYLTIPVFNANNLEIGTNNEDEKEYKKYIKRTIVDEMNDTKKSTMYELQGYINTLDSEGKPIKTLLYKVISPLGSKTKLGYVREYGNEKASIFSENITMLPANVKTFVDSLKKTDPKPIQILNSPIDKSFKKDDEMDENDPIFCAIK